MAEATGPETCSICGGWLEGGHSCTLGGDGYEATISVGVGYEGSIRKIDYPGGGVVDFTIRVGPMDEEQVARLMEEIDGFCNGPDWSLSDLPRQTIHIPSRGE
jgi:hypothetical protein